MRTRVLLVDDDTTLSKLIQEYLEPLGFDLAFAHTGPDGLKRAVSAEWDAVILDVLLPGMDGFELLRRLRASSNVPVLMLTGMGSETDRIVGLEIGADDYLPKTYSMRELLARLRAVLRRRQPAGASGAPVELPVEVHDLHVDPAARLAKLAGKVLELTPVEFDVLLSLARAAGRVRSREQLLHDASAREYDVFDRSVDVHISSLRRKLGEEPANPRYIQTVRAAGYRMPAPGAPLGAVE
jgi:DNA-binding response OmpR family regulator